MPESRRVRANGIDIHYLHEGKGAPLVLLRGWPEFCRVWEQCMAALSDRFELFAPDLRGFGDTTSNNRRSRQRRITNSSASRRRSGINTSDSRREIGMAMSGVLMGMVGEGRPHTEAALIFR
jgi:pimeloyl-ACP methyl ester carboxylesterase